MKRIKHGLILFVMAITGCVKAPPSNVDNVCRIFKQYPKWYHEAQDAASRWHVPISVQMAIIHQESKFNGTIRPARTKLLWVIPWTRPSSAYGYTQALDGTWARYKKAHGNLFSSRDDFGDAVDFIGWYANNAHNRAGIPRNDAYKLYLAYHEGVGGYIRKTYLHKKWLIAVARRVKAQSQLYQAQLATCENSLNKKSWYKFW